MWIINVKVPYNKNTLLGALAKKYSVRFFGYPISHIIEKDRIRMITAGTIIGEQKKITEVIKELSKSSKVYNIEFNNNQLILDISQNKATKFLFEPGIFLTKPAEVNKKGEYFFEIASWEKSKLTKIFMKSLISELKLNKIQQKKITSIELTKTSINLTEKQKEAINLAKKYGYYSHPRKITLKELAKIMNVSYTTFQYHLRTAEEKIIPHSFF